MYVSHSEWLENPRPVPAKTSIYAIGDVHGCTDELSALHTVIRKEVAESSKVSNHVIHLGDYIDRGPDSRGTLEVLANGLGAGAEEVYLVGNHDQYLIELINNPECLDREFMMNWYDNGGIATMKSLDVAGFGRLVDRGDLAKLSARTIHALGPVLVEFLNSLEPMQRIGDYLFVHAGLDPARSVEEQEFTDLLLIREPFLSSAESWPHSFCVVHGHSIAAPAIYSHRIGVDAGCNAYGALCALQLSESGARFIAVTRDTSCSWVEKLGAPAENWYWSTPDKI